MINNSSLPDNITAVACSIFKNEIEKLQKDNKLNMPVIYLDSMLHMFPDKLHESVGAAIKPLQEAGRKILLIYGECSAFMNLYSSYRNTARIKGINCVEAFLGREKYHALRKEGAFFLMPEWTLRWKEIFQNELGLSAENAKSFMREMHTKIIYIDTSVIPVPCETLIEISDYSGLDHQVIKITLDNFINNVNESAGEI
jgi:hypothetical protein